MSQRRLPIQPIISAYYSFKHWKMAGLFAAADYRVDFKVPIVPIDSDLILQFEMEMFSFGCLIKSTSKSTIVFFFLFFFQFFFFNFFFCSPADSKQFRQTLASSSKSACRDRPNSTFMKRYPAHLR